MQSAENLSPKICYTAVGVLIHEGKVLLVKHKKLGIWLNPGGHIEANELPYQAAEREFFEETGVKVRAVNAPNNQVPLLLSNCTTEDDTQYLPAPILVNLHWVCRENYELRMSLGAAYQPAAPWKRGCEQHLGFVYILEPMGGLTFVQDETETDGIGWFTLQELKNLETKESIRKEVEYAFECIRVGS